MFTCQNHSNDEALWECPDCQTCYCGECVKAVKFGRAISHLCAPCDALCRPVSPMQATVPVSSSLASAFSYPFRGSGPLALLGGVLVLGFADLMGVIGVLFGWGLVAGYSMVIIQASALGHDELPDWPDTDLGSIARPAFLALMTGVMSFGPALWLAAEQSFGLAAVALAAGVVYAPMAWIAVAQFGRVFAVTPFVVLPLIGRAGSEYWLASALLVVVGLAEASGQLALTWVLPPLVAAFVTKAVSLYFLAVEMRILGIVCNRRSVELGFEPG